MTRMADGSYLARMLAHVGDRDTMEVLVESAAQVEAAVRRLGPAGLSKPWGPGKWTGRQVLAHIADCGAGSTRSRSDGSPSTPAAATSRSRPRSALSPGTR